MRAQAGWRAADQTAIASKMHRRTAMCRLVHGIYAAHRRKATAPGWTAYGLHSKLLDLAADPHGHRNGSGSGPAWQRLAARPVWIENSESVASLLPDSARPVPSHGAAGIVITLTFQTLSRRNAAVFKKPQTLGPSPSAPIRFSKNCRFQACEARFLLGCLGQRDRWERAPARPRLEAARHRPDHRHGITLEQLFRCWSARPLCHHTTSTPSYHTNCFHFSDKKRIENSSPRNRLRSENARGRCTLQAPVLLDPAARRHAGAWLRHGCG